MTKHAFWAGLGCLWLAGCSGGQAPFHLDPIYNPPGQTLTAGTEPQLPEPTTPYPDIATGGAWANPLGQQTGAAAWNGNGPVNPQVSRERIPGMVSSAAVHCADGLWRVVAGRVLLAFDDQGRVQHRNNLPWAAQSASTLLASPAGDRLYLSQQQSFGAYDLDGTKLWGAPLDGGEYQLVSVDSAGNVLATLGGGYGSSALRVYLPDGNPGWEYKPAGGAAVWGAVQAPGGTVYFLEAAAGAFAPDLRAFAGGHELWSVRLAHGNASGLLLGPDGKLHVVTTSQPGVVPLSAYLESFALDGLPAGSNRLEGSQFESANYGMDLFAYDYDWLGVLPDGSWLVAAHAKHALQSIRPDGSVVWEVPDIAQVSATVPAGTDLLVLGNALNGPPLLARLGYDGTVRWRRDSLTGLQQATALDNGGAIALLAESVLLLGPNGSTGSSLPFPGNAQRSLRTDSAGNSYCLDGNWLRSYTPQLQVRWNAQLPADSARELLLSPAGRLVVVGEASFTVYQPDGSLQGQYAIPGTGDFHIRGAVLGADGTLYLAGMNDRQVAAYSLDGSRQWVYTDASGVQGPLTLDRGGNLYAYSVNYGSAQSLFGSTVQSMALLSLGRSGARRFRLELGGIPAAAIRRTPDLYYSAPLVEAAGSVLVSLSDGRILRCAADGSSAVPLQAPAGVTLVTPLADGALLAAEGVNSAQSTLPHYSGLLKLAASGSQLWRAELGSVGIEAMFTDSADRTYLLVRGENQLSNRLLAVDSAGQPILEQYVATEGTWYGNSLDMAPAANGALVLAVGDELQRLAD
jgi:hypothetical protein